MKKDIDNHRYETWADLEIGMGVYSSQCANKDVFLKCLNDIKLNLRIYLQKESEKIKLYKLNSFSGFLNLGAFLEPELRSQYNSYRNSVASGTLVNIVTFNYTLTLEWLFDFKNSMKPLSDNARLETIQY